MYSSRYNLVKKCFPRSKQKTQRISSPFVNASLIKANNISLIINYDHIRCEGARALCETQSVYDDVY